MKKGQKELAVLAVSYTHLDVYKRQHPHSLSARKPGNGTAS